MKRHFGHRTLKLATASALALGLTAGSDSQAATASANATATVVNPIAITKTQDLAFGKFTKASGNGGTVTINPLGGGRTKTGTIVLLTGSAGNAASFDVTGNNGATYAITLPANGTVTIVSGVNTMAVSAFLSAPGTGTLSIGGS